MEKSNYLKLQPISGKYVKMKVNGKELEIFKVDPRTNEFGTRVPREEAIGLLIDFPDVLTLVQQVEDGKVVSQISDEEFAEVRKARLEKATVAAAVPVTDTAEVDSLKAKAAQQENVIKEQGAAIAELRKMVEELKGSKTSKSTKKAEEEE